MLHIWYHLLFVFDISLSTIFSRSAQCWHKWQCFILFYSWIIFHCIYIRRLCLIGNTFWLSSAIRGTRVGRLEECWLGDTSETHDCMGSPGVLSNHGAFIPHWRLNHGQRCACCLVLGLTSFALFWDVMVVRACWPVRRTGSLCSFPGESSYFIIASWHALLLFCWSFCSFQISSDSSHTCILHSQASSLIVHNHGFTYPPKFMCSPSDQYWWHFHGRGCHVQRGETHRLPVYKIPAEAKQGGVLPSCSSSQTVARCFFLKDMQCHILHIFWLLGVILLFIMASKHNTVWSVPECEKVVTYLTEKVQMLDKLHSEMSHGVTQEFNANESIIHL